MARRPKTEFKPNWHLTPIEALGVTLSMSLFKHIPNWPGCSDAQLEKISRDVIKHLRSEADRILER